MSVSPPPSPPPPPAPPNTCSNCLFFDPSLDGMTGKCRSKSPVQIMGSNIDSFPIVQMVDWCGEWVTEVGGNFP